MAKFSKILDDLTGQTEKREKAEKEAASLVQLADSKLDNLENEMREMFRNKELESQVQIVGDRMGAFSREYRVNYSEGNVSDAVNDLIDQIMTIGTEKIGTIISKAIKNSLNAMFTSVSIQEQQKRLFVVLLEGAAMVRYDIWVWKSCVQDKALFENVKSVVAITYARSVVDHTKLTDDELNDGIYWSLGGPSLDEIIEYKQQLLKLFKLKVNDDTVRAVPDASLSPEEADKQLTADLMRMIAATADQAADQAAAEAKAQTRKQAAVPSPEIQKLRTMDTSGYRPK